MDKQRRKSRKPDGLHRDARITLRLPSDTVHLLDLQAEARGTSRADVVLEVITTSLTVGAATPTKHSA